MFWNVEWDICKLKSFPVSFKCGLMWFWMTRFVLAFYNSLGHVSKSNFLTLSLCFLLKKLSLYIARRLIIFDSDVNWRYCWLLCDFHSWYTSYFRSERHGSCLLCNKFNYFDMNFVFFFSFWFGLIRRFKSL